MSEFKRCDECGRGFETLRNARFCSDVCRYRAWDRDHPRTPRKQPYNGSAGGKRRASRDGHGAKVYLSPEELTRLWVGGKVPASVQAKAQRAVKRLAERTR
jgi:hypothetical protein